MTPLTRRRLSGWLAMAPILAGCASAEPDYYRLVVVPGTPRRAMPRRVELREVGLARYLDRAEIVRGGGSTKLDISSDTRWAEPIGDMVTRVLAENLNQRLPGTTVAPERSSLGGEPDTVAEAEITRFEADSASRVVLRGRFSVRRLGTGSTTLEREFEETLPLESTSTDALARGMSAALGILADRMAEALAGLRAPQPGARMRR
jgi:uncharacterized lipoprotein YmbA